MITVNIPYEFLRDRVRLSWHDVKFGLDRQIISTRVAIDHAAQRLCDAADPTAAEVELAGQSGADEVLELVMRCVASESAEEGNTKARWLYLLLAWLFENRRLIADPLAAVEEVYSDFGYPAEIASFVRYMPMDGPDLGSREKNEARLYENWKRYLDQTGAMFSPMSEQDPT